MGPSAEGPLDGGGRVAAWSTLLNLALVLVKGVLAAATGSAALLAESLHSLTDVLAGLTVWVGIRISRVRSPAFPWGLYKVENVAALVSAVFVFLVAYEVVKDVFTGEVRAISNIGISVPVLVLMTVPVYLFTRYERRRARELNSPSLEADAVHWLSDIASVGVVAAGLLGSYFTPYADKAAAVVAVAFVARSGHFILRDSMKSLLDASVDPATLARIRKTVEGFREVDEIVSLNARNSGRFIFAHAVLRLSVKRLSEAHGVADSIERAVKKEVPFIERVVIHYEPVKKEFAMCAAPLADREGRISEHFGGAPLLAFWKKRLSDGSVLEKEIVENPFRGEKKAKGIKLARLLVERGVDTLYVREDFGGKGPEFVLSDAEVEVVNTDALRLDELP